MNARTPTAGIIAGLVVALVLTGLQSFFIVRVDQFAIVIQFGKPVREVKDSGLNFKIPFIQDVKKLDRRIQGWDDSAAGTKTADSRQIDYTLYARWKIIDPLTYYKNAGDVKGAYAGMDSIVTDRIQKELRSRKLSEIVRETGRNFGARASVDLRNIFDVYEECNPEVNPEFKKALSADTLKLTPSNADETASSSSNDGAMRSAIVNAMVSASNEQLAPEYGIEIVDMHFKYLNYSHQVHEQIIKQIEADRKDDISSYLEVGQKCVGYINRIADAERGTILGEGERRVRELDGEAIAQAIQIKAEAFQKDPEFFQFLKDLEIVSNVMSDRSKLVLSTTNPLLGLLQRGPALSPENAQRVKDAGVSTTNGAQKSAKASPKSPKPRAVKPVAIKPADSGTPEGKATPDGDQKPLPTKM